MNINDAVKAMMQGKVFTISHDQHRSIYFAECVNAEYPNMGRLIKFNNIEGESFYKPNFNDDIDMIEIQKDEFTKSELEYLEEKATLMPCKKRIKESNYNLELVSSLLEDKIDYIRIPYYADDKFSTVKIEGEITDGYGDIQDEIEFDIHRFANMLKQFMVRNGFVIEEYIDKVHVFHRDDTWMKADFIDNNLPKNNFCGEYNVIRVLTAADWCWSQGKHYGWIK